MGSQKFRQRWGSFACLLTLNGVLLLMSACSGGTAALPLRMHTLSKQTHAIDWPQVDAALGRVGLVMPGDVHRYSFPRTDLNVTVQGVHLKAGFALGGYVVFLPVANGTMVMGDLVLTEDEINPVISQLQQGGIELTALHNHLLFEQPRVMYLHIGGQGDPVSLARAIHAALALTETPLGAPAASQPGPLDLDTKQLDAIVGFHGKATDGVYQYSIPRTETITDEGVAIPPAMGVATGINFQPTGAGNAAITGDFVLLAREVPLVLRTLREGGITVTALHTHMLNDSPHLFFVHFWANANAITLAHGLRAALDQTNRAKATR